MTPNAQHTPTAVSELTARLSVSNDIASNFSLPILSIMLRHPTMQTASVPETAIHENHQALSQKYKVRVTRQR